MTDPEQPTRCTVTRKITVKNNQDGSWMTLQKDEIVFMIRETTFGSLLDNPQCYVLRTYEPTVYIIPTSAIKPA